MDANQRIYYRGFNSQYACIDINKPFVWLTDNADYAREYTKGENSLAEIEVDANRIHCADEYDIEELDYNFDYD